MNGQQHLQKIIAEYESDTFSAAGSDITAEEADQIATELIKYWADKNLDGWIISEELENLRDEGEQ